MKKMKHTLAILCVLALFAGILPASAFAMDNYAAAMAQYQQAVQAQMQAQQQAEQQLMQAYWEAQFFNVEEAYKRLVSCRNGEEREEYFFSLNEFQRTLLVEYLGEMAYRGYFRGFDDFEIPGLKLKGTEEQKEQKNAEWEASEEERFLQIYAPYIELYKQYGSAADYSGISYDAYLKIQQLVDGTPAEEAKAEEAAPAEEAETEKGKSEKTADQTEEAVPADQPKGKDASDVDTFPAATAAQPVEEEAAAPAEESVPAEEAAPTEEELFAADYALYIELYKQFGTAADYSAISHDAFLKIQELVDGPAAEAEEVTEPVAEAEAETEVKEPEAETKAEEETDATETDPAEEVSPVEPETVVEEEAEEEAEATEPEAIADTEAEAPVLAAAAPAAVPTVAIASTLTDTIALNEPVTLTAVMENADDYDNFLYVWEVDKGNGFEIVPDATGATYTFPATVESLRWNWRLSVLYS